MTDDPFGTLLVDPRLRKRLGVGNAPLSEPSPAPPPPLVDPGGGYVYPNGQSVADSGASLAGARAAPPPPPMVYNVPKAPPTGIGPVDYLNRSLQALQSAHGANPDEERLKEIAQAGGKIADFVSQKFGGRLLPDVLLALASSGTPIQAVNALITSDTAQHLLTPDSPNPFTGAKATASLGQPGGTQNDGGPLGFPPIPTPQEIANKMTASLTPPAPKPVVPMGPAAQGSLDFINKEKVLGQAAIASEIAKEPNLAATTLPYVSATLPYLAAGTSLVGNPLVPNPAAMSGMMQAGIAGKPVPNVMQEAQAAQEVQSDTQKIQVIRSAISDFSAKMDQMNHTALGSAAISANELKQTQTQYDAAQARFSALDPASLLADGTKVSDALDQIAKGKDELSKELNLAAGIAGDIMGSGNLFESTTDYLNSRRAGDIADMVSGFDPETGKPTLDAKTALSLEQSGRQIHWTVPYSGTNTSLDPVKGEGILVDYQGPSDPWQPDAATKERTQNHWNNPIGPAPFADSAQNIEALINKLAHPEPVSFFPGMPIKVDTPEENAKNIWALRAYVGSLRDPHTGAQLYPLAVNGDVDTDLTISMLNLNLDRASASAALMGEGTPTWQRAEAYVYSYLAEMDKLTTAPDSENWFYPNAQPGNTSLPENAPGLTDQERAEIQGARIARAKSLEFLVRPDSTTGKTELEKMLGAVAISGAAPGNLGKTPWQLDPAALATYIHDGGVDIMQNLPDVKQSKDPIGGQDYREQLFYKVAALADPGVSPTEIMYWWKENPHAGQLPKDIQDKYNVGLMDVVGEQIIKDWGEMPQPVKTSISYLGDKIMDVAGGINYLWQGSPAQTAIQPFEGGASAAISAGATVAKTAADIMERPAMALLIHDQAGTRQWFRDKLQEEGASADQLIAYDNANPFAGVQFGGPVSATASFADGWKQAWNSAGQAQGNGENLATVAMRDAGMNPDEHALAAFMADLGFQFVAYKGLGTVFAAGKALASPYLVKAVSNLPGIGSDVSLLARKTAQAKEAYTGFQDLADKGTDSATLLAAHTADPEAVQPYLIRYGLSLSDISRPNPSPATEDAVASAARAVKASSFDGMGGGSLQAVLPQAEKSPVFTELLRGNATDETAIRDTMGDYGKPIKEPVNQKIDLLRGMDEHDPYSDGLNADFFMNNLKEKVISAAKLKLASTDNSRLIGVDKWVGTALGKIEVAADGGADQTIMDAGWWRRQLETSGLMPRDEIVAHMDRYHDLLTAGGRKFANDHFTDEAKTRLKELGAAKQYPKLYAQSPAAAYDQFNSKLASGYSGGAESYGGMMKKAGGLDSVQLSALAKSESDVIIKNHSAQTPGMLADAIPQSEDDAALVAMTGENKVADQAIEGYKQERAGQLQDLIKSPAKRESIAPTVAGQDRLPLTQYVGGKMIEPKTAAETWTTRYDQAFRDTLATMGTPQTDEDYARWWGQNAKLEGFLESYKGAVANGSRLPFSFTDLADIMATLDARSEVAKNSSWFMNADDARATLAAWMKAEDPTGRAATKMDKGVKEELTRIMAQRADMAKEKYRPIFGNQISYKINTQLPQIIALGLYGEPGLAWQLANNKKADSAMKFWKTVSIFRPASQVRIGSDPIARSVAQGYGGQMARNMAASVLRKASLHTLDLRQEAGQGVGNSHTFADLFKETHPSRDLYTTIGAPGGAAHTYKSFNYMLGDFLGSKDNRPIISVARKAYSTALKDKSVPAEEKLDKAYNAAKEAVIRLGNAALAAGDKTVAEGNDLYGVADILWRGGNNSPAGVKRWADGFFQELDSVKYWQMVNRSNVGKPEEKAVFRSILKGQMTPKEFEAAQAIIMNKETGFGMPIFTAPRQFMYGNVGNMQRVTDSFKNVPQLISNAAYSPLQGIVNSAQISAYNKYFVASFKDVLPGVLAKGEIRSLIRKTPYQIAALIDEGKLPADMPLNTVNEAVRVADSYARDMVRQSTYQGFRSPIEHKLHNVVPFMPHWRQFMQFWASDFAQHPSHFAVFARAYQGVKGLPKDFHKQDVENAIGGLPGGQHFVSVLNAAGMDALGPQSIIGTNPSQGTFFTGGAEGSLVPQLGPMVVMPPALLDRFLEEIHHPNSTLKSVDDWMKNSLPGMGFMDPKAPAFGNLDNLLAAFTGKVFGERVHAPYPLGYGSEPDRKKENEEYKGLLSQFWQEHMREPYTEPGPPDAKGNTPTSEVDALLKQAKENVNNGLLFRWAGQFVLPTGMTTTTEPQQLAQALAAYSIADPKYRDLIAQFYKGDISFNSLPQAVKDNIYTPMPLPTTIPTGHDGNPVPGGFTPRQVFSDVVESRGAPNHSIPGGPRSKDDIRMADPATIPYMMTTNKFDPNDGQWKPMTPDELKAETGKTAQEYRKLFIEQVNADPSKQGTAGWDAYVAKQQAAHPEIEDITKNKAFMGRLANLFFAGDATNMEGSSRLEALKTFKPGTPSAADEEGAAIYTAQHPGQPAGQYPTTGEGANYAATAKLDAADQFKVYLEAAQRNPVERSLGDYQTLGQPLDNSQPMIDYWMADEAAKKEIADADTTASSKQGKAIMAGLDQVAADLTAKYGATFTAQYQQSKDPGWERLQALQVGLDQPDTSAAWSQYYSLMNQMTTQMTQVTKAADRQAIYKQSMQQLASITAGNPLFAQQMQGLAVGTSKPTASELRAFQGNYSNVGKGGGGTRRGSKGGKKGRKSKGGGKKGGGGHISATKSGGKLGSRKLRKH